MFRRLDRESTFRLQRFPHTWVFELRLILNIAAHKLILTTNKLLIGSSWLNNRITSSAYCLPLK